VRCSLLRGAAVAKAAVLQESLRIHRWSVRSPPPSPQRRECLSLRCCLEQRAKIMCVIKVLRSVVGSFG
jgi:hypothetical protein